MESKSTSKRLHALRKEVNRSVFLIIILIISLVACSKTKNNMITKDDHDGEERKPYFVTDVYEVQDKPLIGSRDILAGKITYDEFEQTQVYRNRVYTYDERRNGFVYSARLNDSLVRMKGTWFYYMCDNKLCAYDDGIIAPNKPVPIYKYNNRYYSLYINPETAKYSIVESLDLISWKETLIKGEEPIFLFWQDKELFALGGACVYRIRDESVVRELQKPIFSSYDMTLFYVYCLDDHLVLHFQRTYEDGAGDIFMTINLNDFTYKMKSSEDDLEIGPYEYKAINRTDGWKIYYIGREPADGIKVLDPLAPDGPKIIETLPGINVATEGTELP